MKFNRKTVLPLLVFLFVILLGVLLFRRVEPFATQTAEFPVRVTNVPHNHEIAKSALQGTIQSIAFQLWKNNTWNNLSSTELRNIDQSTKVNFGMDGVGSKTRLRTRVPAGTPLTAAEQGLPFNTNDMAATGKLTLQNLDQLVQNRTAPGDPTLNSANLKILVTYST